MPGTSSSGSAPNHPSPIVSASDPSGEDVVRYGYDLTLPGRLLSRVGRSAAASPCWSLLVRLFGRPLVLITTAFLLVFLLVRPWGEFPLNDDWQYARVVQHLANTWHFRADVGIAPALVLQAYVAAGLVSLFGFSHLLLRLTTMVLATILVWVVDRILATVGVRRGVRVLASALLMLNPIFLHLACSFMTEIYGFLPVLLAVWLWLAHSRRTWTSRGRPMMSYATGVAVGLLIGASFWVRQFCVTAYPAIILSGLLVQLRRRDWPGLLRSLPRLLASGAVFVAIIAAYFAWSRTTGNYRREFGDHLVGLHKIDSKLWQLSGFEVAVYMTAFFYPFLVVVRWSKVRWHWLVALACATMFLIWRGKELQVKFAGFHHHVAFPYSANIIGNLGVGPFTLSPSYQSGLGGPHWPAGIWTAIEWVLIALTFTWSLWWAAPKTTDVRRRTLRCFAMVFGVLSAVFSIQAYQYEVLDRYFFPLILAGVLLLASAGRGLPLAQRRGWPRLCLTAFLLLPIAWFSLGGVHDYFRWNDARWELARHALTLVEPSNLDGGFEVNGWLNFDNFQRNRPPRHCIGPCGCTYRTFTCSDDSYQISPDVPANRVVVAERSPSFWLLPSTKFYLTKRSE